MTGEDGGERCGEDREQWRPARISRQADRWATRTIVLPLEGLAYEELEREAARQGISPAELASYAIVYYLADADSGRIARRLPPQLPPPERPRR